MCSSDLSWPTPRSSDGAHGGPNQRDSSGRPGLAGAVHQWPTPRSSAGMTSQLRDPAKITKGGNSRLEDVVALRQWPTPRASPNEARTRKPAPSHLSGKHGKCLSAEVWAEEVKNPTSFQIPTANRRDGLQSHGQNIVAGSLNPQWVSVLMGYPPHWTEVE